jgi:uncharacterized protein (DUF4415 family)
MQKTYKVIDFPPLTDEQKKLIETLKNVKSEEIDTSDMSECTGNGGFYYIQSLKMQKTNVHTKIDNDNLEWLKQEGKGYQARLNNVIRWARLNNCPITQL